MAGGMDMPGFRRPTNGSLTETTMRDVMTVNPHTITAEQTLALAHDVMRERDLRHLPVMRDGKLVGVVSQRDLYFLEAIAGIEATLERIQSAMSAEVYTVGPEERLADVARVMAENRYGCAVIVDGTSVLGIFTSTDALGLLADVGNAGAKKRRRS
jgi:acetoin utilization protein AcuB